jgi:hypothetical protein
MADKKIKNKTKNNPVSKNELALRKDLPTLISSKKPVIKPHLNLSLFKLRNIFNSFYPFRVQEK